MIFLIIVVISLQVIVILDVVFLLTLADLTAELIFIWRPEDVIVFTKLPVAAHSLLRSNRAPKVLSVATLPISTVLIGICHGKSATPIVISKGSIACVELFA